MPPDSSKPDHKTVEIEIGWTEADVTPHDLVKAVGEFVMTYMLDRSAQNLYLTGTTEKRARPISSQEEARE